MPELPEVEIARRNLVRWLRGATLIDVRAPDRNIQRTHTSRAFARELIGRTVRGLSRRGKWLRMDLDGDLFLFSHLGMTGKWDAKSGEHERRAVDIGAYER